MLRRLGSYKRVQLEGRADYFLKQGMRGDDHELREFARANTPCRGRRWIDRKAAGEAVRDRAITSQPRAIQGAAQCDLRLVSQSLTHIESFFERLRTG
jgi:hypothetical protein